MSASRESMSLLRSLLPPLLSVLALAWAATGCVRMLDRFSPVAAPRTAVPAGPAQPVSAPEPVAPEEHIEGPSAAAAPPDGVAPASVHVVVTGRLVDGVSGLPVRDAGVALLGLERRTITGPDGGFRFDGVPAGALTIVLGPAEGHVARGAHAHVEPGAGDLGVLHLMPASPPTLVVPEYGARIEGCKHTDLTIASDSLPQPVSIRVTCLERERQLPAPPPAGRLPLFVLDLSPGALETLGAARLSVRLPAQPRYGQGVSLDLLRLDLERLIWIPTATLEVDPGGHSASGRLDALGTYMVAAPPFGTFGTDAAGPRIGQLRVAARPDGVPVDLWPATTVLVYAAFDYTGMANTPVTVRTAGVGGGVLFEASRPYADQGRDAVPMVHPNGVWPPGRYVTSVAVGEPPTTAHQVSWMVTDRPTAVPPTATLPAPSAASGAAPGRPVQAPPAGCPTPPGWYSYVVQPGDTLSWLAERTGATVAALLRANCRERTALVAGERLYLPQPPARRQAPGAPRDRSGSAPGPTATAASRSAKPDPWTSPIPPAAPPDVPTTWYTPPAGPAPGKPSPAPATAAPRPTDVSPPATPLPPQPMPTPPPPEATPPSEPGEEPTPKWPTLPPETATP